MADVKRTVEILFQGNDEVSKTLRSIGTGFGQFEQAITTVAQPLARVADGVLIADTALTALAVGGMALAISKASEFETSFAEISTLIDATGENLGRFRDDILDYAQNSTKSIEDINGAVYTAISAGIDYKDALEVMSEAERLAVAGKGDLNDTIRLVASTLNAYGDDVSQAGEYSNAFFNAVKLGQTTLPELADNLSKVTGVAAAAGIPIQDVTAAVAALTAAGMPTTEAMTGLKAVMAAILAPSEEAKKVFADLGVEYGQGAIKAKGLDGVLRELQDATGGNADQMKKLLGGIEGLNAGMILAEDKSGKYRLALEQMRAEQDVVTAAFEKMSQTVDIANQRLENNYTVLLVRIGENLTGAYTDIADAVVNIFQGMTDAVEAGAFADLFAAIDAWAARFADFLREVAVNLPEAFAKVDFDNLIRALQDLGEEIGLVFEGVDLSTPEGLAEAIQGAVDGIAGLINVTRGMVAEFRPIFDAIWEGAQSFNTMGSEAQANFGKVLAASKLVTEAGVAVAGAILVIAESGADVGRIFDAVVGSIKVLWNGLEITFNAVVLGMTVVKESILGLLSGFMDLSESVMNALGIDPSRQFVAMKKAIDDAHESTTHFRQAAMDTLLEDIHEAADGARQAFGELNEQVARTPEIVRPVRQAWMDMMEEISGAPSEFTLEPKVEPTAVDQVLDIIAGKIPDVMDIGLEVDPGGEIEDAGARLDVALPGEKTTEVVAQVDGASVAGAQAELEQAIPPTQTSLVTVELDDGSLLLTNQKLGQATEGKSSLVTVELDDGSLLLTNRELRDGVPESTGVLVKPEVDEAALKKTEKYLIEEMKAQSSLLETTVEWTAKLNIAAVEAEAEKVKAAFESMGHTMESTGEAIAGIFESWGSLDLHGRWEARRALEQELEIQREMADVQMKMIEEQIKLSELKREMIQRGEGLIKIDSTGLEPTLDMLFWQVLEKVQIRATEDAAQFLLGM